MDKEEEKKQPETTEKKKEEEKKQPEIKIGKPISNNMYLFNRYRQAYIPSYTR